MRDEKRTWFGDSSIFWTQLLYAANQSKLRAVWGCSSPLENILCLWAFPAAPCGHRSHGMVQCCYLGKPHSFSHHCPHLHAPRCPALFFVCFWFAVFNLDFLFFYLTLFILFFNFTFGFHISNVPISLILFVVCFCLIPVIPLDHQPGSHLLQCHYFLSQPRSLHTKLPICTLPALSSVHGCGGPAEHALADRNSADLCPARPLPASSHRLPTRLPR